jgi:hypothetical protein
MGGINVANGGRIMTVRVPITIKRRGGRKLVLVPDGAEITVAPVTRHVDNAMVKASPSAVAASKSVRRKRAAIAAQAPSARVPRNARKISTLVVISS